MIRLENIDGRTAAVGCLLLLLVIVSWRMYAHITVPAHPVQTNVGGAEHLFDPAGIPLLKITGIGTVWHPAWTALYALQYAGLEAYGEGKQVALDLEKFRACVNRLASGLLQNANGSWVWEYPFDNTYNDITINAPWVSAFGQAVGIQALVASYKLDRRTDHLLLAEKAAGVLLQPVEKGGLLFQVGDDLWFEEIPVPVGNPPHILNGHMRVLLALKDLAEATGNTEYHRWLQDGLDTLERWLPLFDTGYWLRYDLNPKKVDVLFRITSPKGHRLPSVPVDVVKLRDPTTGREMALDIGTADDSGQGNRIAGGDWSQAIDMDGRTVRLLKPVQPVMASVEADGHLHPPATYLYLSLPTDWKDNLRTMPFEMELLYKDRPSGILSVQIQAIAPGPAFRSLPQAERTLSNSGRWLQWTVLVRPLDLGWPVGLHYAKKHLTYLEALSAVRPTLTHWAATARRYADAIPSATQIRAGRSKDSEEQGPIPFPQAVTDSSQFVVRGPATALTIGLGQPH